MLWFMNYINDGMIKRFSLSLKDHQITHFMDDIDGMEMELLFHNGI